MQRSILMVRFVCKSVCSRPTYLIKSAVDKAMPCWRCRASIAASLKAVTQQLHEAEAKNKHLIELESDLERREDIFESQVRQSFAYSETFCE